VVRGFGAAAKLLTRDEARRIAANIAKLKRQTASSPPSLLWRLSSHFFGFS